MSYQGQVTRLETHRLAFRSAEIPMTGPLLRFQDLSPEERRIVDSAAVQRVRELASDGRDFTTHDYLEVLHSWGIMCPHPLGTRTYEGLYWSDIELSFDECRWYDCDTCGCIVINR